MLARVISVNRDAHLLDYRQSPFESHHHVLIILSKYTNVWVNDVASNWHAPILFILVKLSFFAEGLTALKNQEHNVF